MKFEDVRKNVLEWAEDKDLIHELNAGGQFLKFIEEVFEFKTEMDDLMDFINEGEDIVRERMALEMGDVFVTLIILCEQVGLDPTECLERAYEKIKNRKGKTVGGLFVKEEDLDE